MDNNANIAIYADDTAVYASSWSPDKASTYIQGHMDTLINYFNNWKLLINPTKTQAKFFPNKRTETPKQIKIATHSIPWSTSVKYFGVFLDSKITWAHGIDNRAKLAYPSLLRLYPFIARNSKLKTTIKITLYKTCIRPIITYGH